jgi:hypothetical protein
MLWSPSIGMLAARVEDSIAASEAAMAQESQVRKAILQGMDPQTAYLTFGKF